MSADTKTKFCDRTVLFVGNLIHWSSWSGLMAAEPIVMFRTLPETHRRVHPINMPTALLWHVLPRLYHPRVAVLVEIFVKLEELRIAIARKLIPQNRPGAQYLHINQPSFYAGGFKTQHLIVDTIDLRWDYWKISYPSRHSDCFSECGPVLSQSSGSHSWILRRHSRRKIVPDMVGSNNPTTDYRWLYV